MYKTHRHNFLFPVLAICAFAACGGETTEPSQHYRARFFTWYDASAELCFELGVIQPTKDSPTVYSAGVSRFKPSPPTPSTATDKPFNISCRFATLVASRSGTLSGDALALWDNKAVSTPASKAQSCIYFRQGATETGGLNEVYVNRPCVGEDFFIEEDGTWTQLNEEDPGETQAVYDQDSASPALTALKTWFEQRYAQGVDDPSYPERLGTAALPLPKLTAE